MSVSEPLLFACDPPEYGSAVYRCQVRVLLRREAIENQRRSAEAHQRFLTSQDEADSLMRGLYATNAREALLMLLQEEQAAG